MKKMKVTYWVFTGLMAAFMLMSSIPDVLRLPEAVAFFTHLGYPAYLLPFIGVAKILGVIAVLIPGFRRLREWAYAGLVFDLIGAFYSHIAVGDPPNAWIFAVIALLLVISSYLLYRKKMRMVDRSLCRRGSGRSRKWDARAIKQAGSIPGRAWPPMS